MMNTDQTQSNRSIRAAIFKFVLPILGSSVLEMLVGFISMALIGNLGFIAIGAMGLSTRVRGIIWAVYKGIAIGAQVVVAQSFGAGNHKRIKEATSQTVGSIFLLSLVFVATIWIFPQHWLGIFGAKGELLGTAIEVLKVVSLGLPFLGIIMIVSGILQGRSDAMTPMWINGLMNILNAVLGLVLVNGFAFVPKLGLMGAAIAMVLSQFIASIFAICILVKKGGILEGHRPLEWLKFSRPILASVYKTGLPSAAESLFWQLSTIIVIRAILSYGDQSYAAYQLGLQAESIAYMPAGGFAVAATAYIGCFLGAGNPDLAKRYFREIFIWTIVISTVGGGLLVIFPAFLLGIMTHDASLIQIASSYLVICGLVQVPQNLAGILGGALRGAGYTKAPMYSAAIGLYGVRVPISLLAAFVFHWPLIIVFFAIGLDMACRLLFNGWLYRRTNIYEHARLV